MKIWQFLSPIVGLSTFASVLSIAVAKVPPAIAQYFPPTVPTVQPLPMIYPLDGVWKLQWRIKGHSFDGILNMAGNSGIMTVNVRYPNGQTDIVQERMLLQSAGDGFILSGQNPVYVGTNVPISSYSPDTFLIERSRDLEGWSAKICDSTERCSRANMQYISPASPVAVPIIPQLP